MRYKVYAACSDNYREIAAMCVPSWYQNLRFPCKEIQVEFFPHSKSECPEVAWLENAVTRMKLLSKAVENAVKSGVSLVSLDVDCFVLGDLGEGFSESHPFSIARWPDINIGVMFFNTSIRTSSLWCNGLTTFLDSQIEHRCDEFIRRRPKKFRMGDQEVWEEFFHKNVHQVCKLDADVWNLCYSLEERGEGGKKFPRFEQELVKNKDRVKVIHWKARHHGMSNPALAIIKREFPNLVR